ncbi:MAG: hypothetical protein IIV45_00245 [Lachnospiraceae bacterium]|nr:hypothetical protein [Lachnospiraceae bacterium]
MENNKLSTGLTVWLWIVFVINVIMSVVSIFAVLGASAVAVTLGLSGAYVVLCAVSAIAEIVLTVALGIILFGHKKLGLTMLIVIAVISFVLNLVTNGMLNTLTVGNIIKSIISVIVLPGITILLAKNDVENGTIA